MARIFISYRRADSQANTGRIYDHLVKAFGQNDVFRDLNAIPPGTNFKLFIRDGLQSAKVVLVIIGPTWASITDTQGNRRLDDDTDLVRAEVETALALPHITVVPVLVSGAAMPSPKDLPGRLAELCDKNARHVRDDLDFDHDIERLIGDLKKLLYPRKPIRKKWEGLAILSLVGLIAIALLLAIILKTGNMNGGNSLKTAKTNTMTPQVTLVGETVSSTPTQQLTLTQTPQPLPTATHAPTDVATATEKAVPVESPTTTGTSTYTQTTTFTPSYTSTPTITECGSVVHDEITSGEKRYYSIGMEPGDILNVSGEAIGDYLELDMTFYSPHLLVLDNVSEEDNFVFQTGVLSERGNYVIEVEASENTAGSFILSLGCVLFNGDVVDPAGKVLLTPSRTPSFTPTSTPSKTQTPEVPVLTPPSSPLPQPTLVSTPALPATTSYPCLGTIKSTSSNPLLVVYGRPNSRQSPIKSVMPGTSVEILSKYLEVGKLWYEIRFGEDHSTGWIRDTYVLPSDNCP